MTKKQWIKVSYPLWKSKSLPDPYKTVAVRCSNKTTYAGYVSYTREGTPIFIIYDDEKTLSFKVLYWCDCLDDLQQLQNLNLSQ